MIEIGITGNIGSGKSAVSDYLIERGFPVIDADEIVKRIYLDPDYIKKMIHRFGEGIIQEGSATLELDKRKIFDIVFNDKKKLAMLDKVVGPFFKKILNQELENHQDEEIVFLDIPLLYEKNYQRFMDKVILVYCQDKVRFQRASIRDNKTIEQIQLVDKSQMSQELKRKKADYVLDNSGSLESLHKQIEDILMEIKNLNEEQ